MAKNVSPGADINLALVLIGIALLVIYGTLDLPPGSFDPLGSASIPQFVAGAIIVLSIWIIARALRAKGTDAGASDGESDADALAFRRRPDLALALVVMALAYVAVMALDWVSFSIATLVFMLASVSMLAGFERRVLPVIAVLAVVFGFGLEYVFTQVFVIDLP